MYSDQPRMFDPESPHPHRAIKEEEALITKANDNNLDIDYEADSDMNHSLVGCQIHAFYVNDWFTGTITWYNRTMEKSRVAFNDETKYYIGISDIDEVWIYLI